MAEAFLVAWRRLEDAPSSHGDLRAWLFGITRHCLMNARRGQDRQEALAVQLAEVGTSVVVKSNETFQPILLSSCFFWCRRGWRGR